MPTMLCANLPLSMLYDALLAFITRLIIGINRGVSVGIVVRQRAKELFKIDVVRGIDSLLVMSPNLVYRTL
jgi:hypothetical protein